MGNEDLLGLAEPPFDKNGRRIAEGDILKVFHFIGRRNKRHFMYKQVLETVTLGRGENSSGYFRVGHLTLNPTDYYHLELNGEVLRDYEIVQSVGASFEDRPRASLKDSER